MLFDAGFTAGESKRDFFDSLLTPTGGSAGGEAAANSMMDDASTLDINSSNSVRLTTADGTVVVLHTTSDGEQLILDGNGEIIGQRVPGQLQPAGPMPVAVQLYPIVQGGIWVINGAKVLLTAAAASGAALVTSLILTGDKDNPSQSIIFSEDGKSSLSYTADGGLRIDYLRSDGIPINTVYGDSRDSFTDAELGLFGIPPLEPDSESDQTNQTAFPAEDDPPEGYINPGDENAGDDIAMPGTDIENSRVTTDDTIMEASRWGDILIAAGIPQPNSDHQAHHVIPRTDGRGNVVRQILEAAGIDINDPSNLIWLPKNERVDNPLGRTPHNDTFTNDYFNYLEDQLVGAPIEDVPDLIDEIKEDLDNGERFQSGQPRN